MASSATESPNVSRSIEPKKTASSVHDIHAEQPPFGSRYLTSDKDVWSKNAWDHVPPPDDQDEKIAASLARQHARPVAEEDKAKYNEKPARHWDNFYKMNADNFFRNRKWLHTEFPDLVAATHPDAGPVTIAELGCGAGNSVFPLLASNQNPKLKFFAFDYSSHAVKLVQHNELYASPPVGTIHASVWDLSSTQGLPDCIAPGSVDIVVLIFVLSALHPDEWAQAVANIYKMLKPGGLVVLRDYGRHDLTQLRFKEGRLLADNFYIRGDKTRVYFFDLDELAVMFTGAPVPAQDRGSALAAPPVVVYEDDDEGQIEGTSATPGNVNPTPTPSASAPSTPALPELDNPPSRLSSIPSAPGVHTLTATSLAPAPSAEHSSTLTSTLGPAHALAHTPRAHPPFTTTTLGVDRRLLVNRKRQLKMYRVWMQAAFRKLPEAGSGSGPVSVSVSEAGEASASARGMSDAEAEDSEATLESGSAGDDDSAENKVF